MSLTSYRAAPPRVDLVFGCAAPDLVLVMKGRLDVDIRLVDLAATYSPVP